MFRWDFKFGYLGLCRLVYQLLARKTVLTKRVKILSKFSCIQFTVVPSEKAPIYFPPSSMDDRINGYFYSCKSIQLREAWLPLIIHDSNNQTDFVSPFSRSFCFLKFASLYIQVCVDRRGNIVAVSHKFVRFILEISLNNKRTFVPEKQHRWNNMKEWMIKDRQHMSQ